MLTVLLKSLSSVSSVMYNIWCKHTWWHLPCFWPFWDDILWMVWRTIEIWAEVFSTFVRQWDRQSSFEQALNIKQISSLWFRSASAWRTSKVLRHNWSDVMYLSTWVSEAAWRESYWMYWWLSSISISEHASLISNSHTCQVGKNNGFYPLVSSWHLRDHPRPQVNFRDSKMQ